MRSARFALVVVTVGALTLAGVLSAQQPKPAKPMQLEKVKDGLFVIRGPFNPCAPNGCGGAYGDDGLLHEAGDVAVRVTSEGLILVDDKFQNNVSEILEHVKSVSALPVKYLLNTHHHTDHAGGDAVIYFPDLKVIHSGDLITEGMPVLDYNNGASAVEWVKVLDEILKLDFDIVIPGHGALLNKDRIRSDRQKLVTMNQRMAELARKGIPLEQVFDQLKLADLGWDHTVSTEAFKGGLKGYYEEMKRQ